MSYTRIGYLYHMTNHGAIYDKINNTLTDSLTLDSPKKLLKDETLKTLKVGDELDGIVRNVVDFGAFVDCGVKYDGLVHISKMSQQKVNHPTDILNVGDEVHVHVIEIDYVRHKLGLALYKC